MKALIKSLVRKLGYDIVTYQDLPDRTLSVFPYVLAVEAAADHDFFFVQIGANDGVRNDPLWETVTRLRLRGLLVEPVPDLFARLKANYSDCPNLLFEQAAVAHRAGNNPPIPCGARCVTARMVARDRKPGQESLEWEEIRRTGPGTTHPVARRAVHDLCPVTKEAWCHSGVASPGRHRRLRYGGRQHGLGMRHTPRIIHYEYIHSPPPKRAALKRLLAEKGYRVSGCREGHTRGTGYSRARWLYS